MLCTDLAFQLKDARESTDSIEQALYFMVLGFEC